VSKAIEFGEKNAKFKGYYAVQGHRGRYKSKARMQLPISDKILTDIISHTGLEFLQLIVQILDTTFLTPLGLGTTYDVHLGLIGKRVMVFQLVLIELFFVRCYNGVTYGRKYTVSKNVLSHFWNDFINCQPILKILSLLDTVINYLQNKYNASLPSQKPRCLTSH